MIKIHYMKFLSNLKVTISSWRKDKILMICSMYISFSMFLWYTFISPDSKLSYALFLSSSIKIKTIRPLQ